MDNLVGRTVFLSPINRKLGGNDTRKLTILSMYDEDGKRWYEVQDCTSLQKFPALG
jgi:hypothetical protein